MPSFVVRGLLALPTFNPTSLFAGGQTGGWWDPSDHATTFQDTGGVTPATTAGQSVNRINDKSGNGNFMVPRFAAVGGTAPTLRNSGAIWWLEFVAASSQDLGADFTNNQPITHVHSARQQVFGASNNRIIGGGPGAGNITDIIQQSAGGSPTIELFAGAEACATTDMTMNVDHCLTGIVNGASSKLAVDNGTYATGDAGAQSGTGVSIASYGFTGIFTDMLWYGGITIGRVLTAPEIANCRTFFGAKAGLSL